MFNNFLSVLYAQRSESFSKINNMSILKLLVYISYISVPALSLIVIFTGEYEKVLAFKNFSAGFFFTLFLSCSLTMALNISYFVSIEKNSSLFTQILANSKVNTKNLFRIFSLVLSHSLYSVILKRLFILSLVLLYLQ